MAKLFFVVAAGFMLAATSIPASGTVLVDDGVIHVAQFIDHSHDVVIPFVNVAVLPDGFFIDQVVNNYHVDGFILPAMPFVPKRHNRYRPRGALLCG